MSLRTSGPRTLLSINFNKAVLKFKLKQLQGRTSPCYANLNQLCMF